MAFLLANKAPKEQIAVNTHKITHKINVYAKKYIYKYVTKDDETKYRIFILRRTYMNNYKISNN